MRCLCKTAISFAFLFCYTESRIEKAKDLILNTDMKIYEVACSVGYPDQKYFSKVFKEYTGVSAKQFAVDAQRKQI